MLGYIVRRLISAVLVVIITSMLVFALFFYGPSNPGQALCSGVRCTAERVEQINVALGFNDPVVDQYRTWAKGVVAGRKVDFGGAPIDCPAPCFGVSYQDRIPVTETLAERFPATLSLAIGAAFVFFPLGLLLGVLAARKRGTAVDRGLVGSSLILSSIPFYLVGLMSFLYLVTFWGLAPQPDYNPITENPWKWWTGLLLPWVVLGIWNSTAYARFSRGSMLESLGEDYVRTARAKGLTERTIVVKHALRAAIVPVLTIFGLDFAGLLAGTVFTEYIFGINGIGRTALLAINNQDFPIIAASVLIAAAFVVLANLIVDILYSVVDPRVRLT